MNKATLCKISKVFSETEPLYGDFRRKNVMSILAEATSTSGTGSMGFMIFWLVLLFALMYFMMIRPQKKEQQRKDAMLSELAIGDTVLTTSGFYGIIIDISDDTVIIEFGNNKNCRIPMQKAAIAAVEKPEDAVAEKTDKKADKKEKKAEK